MLIAGADSSRSRGDCRSGREVKRPGRRLATSGRSFWLMWWFIGAVSVVDAALVLVNDEVILNAERNWICLQLMRLDPRTFHYFLSAKACGTTVVLAVLHVVFARSRRHGLAIAGGVAAYQLWLLTYLAL